MSDVSRYGATEAVEVDENLGKLLAKGDFSGFHLARAREFMAQGKFKEAAYQATASLSHDPSNSAARDLRTEAKAKAKAKA